MIVIDLLTGKVSWRLCGVWNVSLVTLARTARIISVLALVASASAWAQTAQGNAAACPGASAKFPLMTYDESVQYLGNPECQTSFLDAIQRIPLGKNEDHYLSFGFWIRERGEYVSNPNWSDTPGNAYLMQRYFLHTNLVLGQRFRFFGELASSLETGRNGGPRAGLDEEKMYVHQGFFDLGLWKSGGDSLRLRPGRQEIAFGSQNLVSTRDGRNIRTSFDGGRLTWVKRDWTVDLFAARPVLNTNTGYFDNPPNHTTGFWAAYAVHPFRLLPRGNIDLYYMGIDNASVTYNGKGTGREQRETFGTRLWGTTEHWDYNDEFTLQVGSFRSNDIRAWAISTETGYRIDQAPLSPRFGLRAVALSGDQNPASHTLGTFNSMYEKGPYFSYAELFARRNLVALQPSADLKLSKSVSLLINPAFFWRESTRDGLYSIGNSVVVSGLNSNARYISTQASTQLQWRMTRHMTWSTEYAHFFPGQFIKQATPGHSINFWTGWLDIRY